MSALGRVVRAGAGRRRVQTVVIGLVVMLAVTSAILGGSLMVASSGPFDRAFTQQRGAHLTAQFDATKATAAQLSASAQAAGVVAAAGPFQLVPIAPVDERDAPLRPMTVVGRADPGGASVDAIVLTKGRWATGPGEIVLHSDGREGRPTSVGEVLRLPNLPGSPTLTVVGVARSVSETAGGWVAPQQMAALTAPGTVADYQMLYRFTTADTAAQVETGRAAVRASVPTDALIGSRSWLTTRTESVGETKLFVPFLIAFGVLGVLMAVLIIGNVIAGAVGTATHRIGILKALGFTPNQVVKAYLGQALIPAGIGAALGVVVGNVLTLPVLSETNAIYGTTDSGVVPWVNVAVLAGALALVTVTAWAAAARAGGLRTVDVLAVGRTPSPGRGQWAARLTARLALPRPVTLGLAHPFARPVRSATIVAAIAFGVAAVTFAIGLGSSLGQVQATQSHGDVVILPGRPMSGPPGGGPPGGGPPGGGPPEGGPPEGGPPEGGPFTAGGPPSSPDPAKAVGAITAQSGTSGYSGVAQTETTVAGLTNAVEVIAFTGNNSSYGYRMVSGSWFDQAGEIVVATPFLTATNTKVGDTIVLTDQGVEITARIVGEAFNTQNDGMQILTAATTLAAAEPDLRAREYHITVKPGTDIASYIKALNNSLTGVDATAIPAEEEEAEFILIINSLTTLLTLMLVTVAALGVLNMVVLENRERIHDLGVHKALGMTPRQTISMVIGSVVVTGLIGGTIGAPIGVLLQRMIVTEMGRSTGFHLPASIINIYEPTELILFGLGGLLIAILGALMPSGLGRPHPHRHRLTNRIARPHAVRTQLHGRVRTASPAIARPGTC